MNFMPSGNPLESYVLVGICVLLIFMILKDVFYECYYKWRARRRCAKGKHRLYETVGNRATGMPVTGYACYECGRKWDNEGNERPADGTDH